ncbi:GNAT family N-acetyltransferase [Micromonospora sp. NBC_01813]|uniref:GNAT family N-acetyltransferase n=1 Tax=Micromonospora sp. NBC_01813 TaxID=2975988 RepID=UPI002DD89C67|nr:GNAT family N-acetyltransferase [Micromonospora sp. NBC_01813]
MSTFTLPGPLGTMTIEPLDVTTTVGHLHAWITHPRSVFWGMPDADLDTVRREYERIADNPHHHAWLGRLDGEPLFLAETYEPAHSELANHYPVLPGDVGMHVLVAPPTGEPRHGTTSAVMHTVLAFIFAQPAHRRVVVEPDVRNEAIAAKNAEAGFVVERLIRLSDKQARLSFCTRAAFTASTSDPTDLVTPPEHLNPAAIATAHRHLVTKAIAEFSHERLISPELDDQVPAGPGGDGYRLATTGQVSYRFQARRYSLDHWLIDPTSLTRDVAGAPAPLDALELVIELQATLGIPPKLLGTYLEEISATLAGAAWKHHHRREQAADLAHADFQTIESAMTEGHPLFVANNGRIGFGLTDHTAYAPEAGADVRLVWLAVRRDLSAFTAGHGVDEQTHYLAELGTETLRRFADRLRALGLDPDDYRYLPVHPWQWEHKVGITFAADVAARSIVPVGTGADRYRAQQSIRTFFNIDQPHRHYVKTALSIQNMGFMRGLSPAYMRATPPINDWVAELVAADDTLRDCGFEVLRELASVGYTGDAYHRSGAPVSAYQRMLAALWRESPVPRIGSRQRLATMASLLHRDHDGAHLATALVAASGLPAADWVARYLRAYLRPLLHCLLRYDVAFMPHGENLILVLEDHVPVRVFMKDIGEEVVALHDRELPSAVERIRMPVDDDFRVLAIFTDVFDGFLRFLAAILDTDRVLPAAEFWRLVAECVRAHGDDHPELRDRLDFFTPTFRHSCLNRLQLRNTLQMVDLTDQAGSLIYAGTQDNPIATVLAPAR